MELHESVHCPRKKYFSLNYFYWNNSENHVYSSSWSWANSTPGLHIFVSLGQAAHYPKEVSISIKFFMDTKKLEEDGFGLQTRATGFYKFLRSFIHSTFSLFFLGCYINIYLPEAVSFVLLPDYLWLFLLHLFDKNKLLWTMGSCEIIWKKKWKKDTDHWNEHLKQVAGHTYTINPSPNTDYRYTFFGRRLYRYK